MNANQRPRFTETTLSIKERPTKLYEFVVTGIGVFPMDMLRHDCCWPQTGDDASTIALNGNRRSVGLRSYQKPTVARWTSFLWSCSTEAL
jgi:hypothetical protein